MKVEEIQIGDWVQNPLGWRAQVRGIRRIQAITDEFEWRVKIGLNDDTFTDLSLGEIEPIPLTPEILENNDFIEDSTNGLHSTYHLLVPAGIEKNIYTVQVTFYKEPICGVSTLFKCWGPYSDGVNDIHLCNLHYVHEMQHVFRLFGIEKTIEL